ncbi:hypothetical protein ACE1B6_24760 [Aerosakkonemataceae cyanobacterium BLCC-F154]|uniref:Lipoprotein n=1 Tax=Floridaenema fluviatile BLCC-F154 TaxID=3153640 RepID=A0ABV4YI83_9CYAN
MNTNHRNITPIFATIFSQLSLVLLLTISVTGVLAGCVSNPLQNQPELKENSSEEKSVNQEKQNNNDDDDDDKKKNSQGKDDDDDDD